MVNVAQGLLSANDIADLRSYMDIDDDRTDQRPDVRTKHPIWDQTPWPQNIIETKLDQLLPQGYGVEEVTFIDTSIPFKLHVDSGDGSPDIFKAILFPLHIDPCAHTVFFDNHWHGAKTKFSRDPVGRFHYVLQDRTGQSQEVPDIRDLLHVLEHHPEHAGSWDTGAEFQHMLRDLIDKRQGHALSPVPDSQSDYSGLTNLTDLPLDPDIHQQYLQHLSLNTLHGLTIDSIVPWHAGSAIVFDRDQLHCASHRHSRKIFVTVFTVRQHG